MPRTPYPDLSEGCVHRSVPPRRSALIRHLEQVLRSGEGALAYIDAIVWDARLGTDEMWERLHANFTPEELMELGFFIALTSGQQRLDQDPGPGSRRDPGRRDSARSALHLTPPS